MLVPITWTCEPTPAKVTEQEFPERNTALTAAEAPPTVADDVLVTADVLLVHDPDRVPKLPEPRAHEFHVIGPTAPSARASDKT